MSCMISVTSSNKSNAPNMEALDRLESESESEDMDDGKGILFIFCFYYY